MYKYVVQTTSGYIVSAPEGAPWYSSRIEALEAGTKYARRIMAASCVLAEAVDAEEVQHIGEVDDIRPYRSGILEVWLTGGGEIWLCAHGDDVVCEQDQFDYYRDFPGIDRLRHLADIRCTRSALAECVKVWGQAFAPVASAVDEDA